MDAAEEIRGLVEIRGEIANRDLVEHLGISAATSHRLLQGLVLAGVVERRGKGRSTRYRLRRIRRTILLAGSEEDTVWREVADEIVRIRPLAPDESQSLRYAATEVINNAIDHSGGKELEIAVDFEGQGTTTVRVADDGIGVFHRVCKDFGYETAHDAIVQLEKGKLTSDPSRHSGEGLFFSSKAVSRFRLESGGVAWIVDNIIGDSAVAPSDVTSGTRVVMQVVRGRTPQLPKVFAAYTDPETLRFMKTRATVKLSAFGSSLISRSEAKRVTERLAEFESAVLDFSGVEVVGQGFCDEVFRIFASAHPEIRLEPVGMNEAVTFMVARAQARAG
jgi:anti-sigma regulatory factor (Ser/Thr protein kinase)